jgi:hypothetical protein
MRWKQKRKVGVMIKRVGDKIMKCFRNMAMMGERRERRIVRL